MAWNLRSIAPKTWTIGWFHQWGYPNSWMVCNGKYMNRPQNGWLLDGYPHDFGNLGFSRWFSSGFGMIQSGLVLLISVSWGFVEIRNIRWSRWDINAWGSNAAMTDMRPGWRERKPQRLWKSEKWLLWIIFARLRGRYGTRVGHLEPLGSECDNSESQSFRSEQHRIDFPVCYLDFFGSHTDCRYRRLDLGVFCRMVHGLIRTCTIL